MPTSLIFLLLLLGCDPVASCEEACDDFTTGCDDYPLCADSCASQGTRAASAWASCVFEVEADYSTTEEGWDYDACHEVVVGCL